MLYDQLVNNLDFQTERRWKLSASLSFRPWDFQTVKLHIVFGKLNPERGIMKKEIIV